MPVVPAMGVELGDTPLETKQELGAVDAALVIVRTLLATSPDGAERVRLAEPRARHCQLMASRLHLDPVQSHRLALAAWLFRAEGMGEIVQEFARKHELADILFPDHLAESASRIEARILALVTSYEALKQQFPDLSSDSHELKKQLRKVMPEGREFSRLVGLFCNLLESESFLVGRRQATGRILIVDPQEAITPIISPPLTSDGHEVRVAPTAGDACNLIYEWQPDAILVDMDLPIKSGVEFCQEVKAHRSWANVPVLLMASGRSKRNEKAALQAGAEGLLRRPVDLEELFLKLSRLLRTPAQDKPSALGNGVSGALQDIGFADMIQILTVGGRSFTVSLIQGDANGKIWIRNGEIIHAEEGGSGGEAAFYRLMHWETGSFIASPCETFDQQTIHKSAMALLLEGSKTIDRADT